MNRRSFLTSLIAAATLDPERLLWIPGRKTISIANRMEIAEFSGVQISKVYNNYGQLEPRVAYYSRFGRGPWIQNTCALDSKEIGVLTYKNMLQEIASHIEHGALPVHLEPSVHPIIWQPVRSRPECISA